MYLIATHIPIVVEGKRRFIPNALYSVLVHYRDYFKPHFGGRLVVMGPSRQRRDEDPTVPLEEIVPSHHGFEVVSSVSAEIRAREWPRAAKQWRADFLPLVQRATLVHAGIGDPFRPFQRSGLQMGLKHRLPTVLVGFDMDVWHVLFSKFWSMKLQERTLAVGRSILADGFMRQAVGKVSVAMLKEGTVYDRYAPWSSNPKKFCHSMHARKHVISEPELEARLHTLRQGRRMRFGYFGRFVRRKGLLDAIRILALARSVGVDAEFQLIGWGEQEEELRRCIEELGVGEFVRMTPSIPYGEALHRELRSLDGLLFSPTEEDTPRMVYDAMAAAMPLVTTDIPFLRARADTDGVSRLFPVGDIEAGARVLQRLDQDRDGFAILARRAREAGIRHCVENWYQRRLEWTQEAVEAHHRRHGQV